MLTIGKIAIWRYAVAKAVNEAEKSGAVFSRR
jgi:hypothetical protein